MRKIFKWTLDISDRQTVMVPKGAKLLTVQVQGGDPQLWALCDLDQPKEERHIAIRGTGHPISDDIGEYIATFQLMGGTLIFHTFESR